MSDWLNVSSTTPRIAYTATAGQTIFVVPFVFHDETHLLVYKNGNLLTLSTDYTVTGEDVEAGGSITLVTGAALNDSITIVRAVPYTVTTHLPLSGPLDIGALNIQYSLLVMMMQQFDADRVRSIRQPNSDVVDLAELPVAAARAGKYLGFDADGQLSLVTSVVTDEALAINNGKLVWTVGASALTVTLRTTAGNTPSVSDPVTVRVRDATVGTDANDVLTISSALSLTVSSGSTLGTSNNAPFRLWAVLFNDAGTARLGILNCVSAGNILNLGRWQIASSTAEGGAGAADSGHVFYSGAAVSSKPYAILGYGAWETGLAAAGTWSGAPTRVQVFGPGVPLPGTALRSWSASSTANDSTTSTSFVTTSLTVSVVLSSAANALSVFAYGTLTNDGTAVTYAQLQRGGTGVGAIVNTFNSSSAGIGAGCPLGGDDYPGTVASTAYTVAIKVSASTGRWVGAAGGGSAIKATELMT